MKVTNMLRIPYTSHLITTILVKFHIDRLREEQGGSIKRPNVKVLVASVGDNMMVERMKLAKCLWDANISAEFSQQDNPKLKYEIANSLDRDIPFMAIVGEEEAKEGGCNCQPSSSPGAP